MPKITIVLEDVNINGYSGVEIRVDIKDTQSSTDNQELTSAQVLSARVLSYIDSLRTPVQNEKLDPLYTLTHGSMTPN